jgi:hypothetical protein
MNSASRRDNQGEPISRQCTDLSCKNFMLIDASIRILLLFAARLSIRATGKASHMSGLWSKADMAPSTYIRPARSNVGCFSIFGMDAISVTQC